MNDHQQRTPKGERQSPIVDLTESSCEAIDLTDCLFHDLRNLLLVADGQLELIGCECDSPHIETMAETLSRINSLTTDIHTVTNGDRLDFAPEYVSLASVANECWNMVKTGDSSLTVHTKAAIKADRSRLQQLLCNLFRNAIEHNTSAVEVHIDLLDNGRGFFVEDTGDGFTHSDPKQVPTPGYSTHPTGTGFGLSIVQHVARTHEWDVGMCSPHGSGMRIEICDVSVND